MKIERYANADKHKWKQNDLICTPAEPVDKHDHVNRNMDCNGSIEMQTFASNFVCLSQLMLHEGHEGVSYTQEINGTSRKLPPPRTVCTVRTAIS